MNIAVIGAGYVGLVTGVSFANLGNDVVCVENDREKLALLRKAVPPFYELGLAELLKKNIDAGRLRFSDTVSEGIRNAEAIFIAVGTPSLPDGSADLSAVWSVAEEIAAHLDHKALIVTKSTVPPGTTKELKNFLASRLDVKFEVANNPEFLRQGTAIRDFILPDRIICGVEGDYGKRVLGSLYSGIARPDRPILFMDTVDSELVKYASNTFLALKISFINEIASFCASLGGNIDEVAKGMGLDRRIAPRFLHAGIGFGGSCFPKDTKALVYEMEKRSLYPGILKEVLKRNQLQRMLVIEKLKMLYPEGISGKSVGIWGLSFKPNTDDMRNAPSIDIISALLEEKAVVRAYDPYAMKQANRIFPDVTYCPNAYDAAREVDALLVLTEWHEFRDLDFERVVSLMHNPVMVDGRNMFNPRDMSRLGFRYLSIGRRDYI